MSWNRPTFTAAPIALLALLVTWSLTGCASHGSENGAQSEPMIGPTVRAQHGMVVRVSAPASAAGVRVLQR